MKISSYVMLVILVLSACTVMLSEASCNTNVSFSEPFIPAADINLILLEHNLLRLRVEPPAKEMPMLRWSSELARLAHEYVLRCPGLQHSSQASREHRAGWRFINENLAAGMWYLNGEGWRKAIEMWGDERHFYTFADSCSTFTVCGTCVPEYPFPDCGHYTQIVWANTTYVGCAYSPCTGDADFEHQYVCWYGAGGNIQRHAPYVRGSSDDQPCSVRDLFSDGSAPPPPNHVPGGNSGSDSSNGGLIAGGVIGGLVGAVLIVGLVIFFVNRQSSKVYLNEQVPQSGRSRAFTQENTQHAFEELEEQLNPLPPTASN